MTSVPVRVFCVVPVRVFCVVPGGAGVSFCAEHLTFQPSLPASPEIPLLKRPYALFLLTNCKRPALSGLTMSQSGGVFSPFSSLFQAFSPRFVLLQFP